MYIYAMYEGKVVGMRFATFVRLLEDGKNIRKAKYEEIVAATS